jgi:hypothetical protein
MTTYTVTIKDTYAPGITAARKAFNAMLPATVADPAHQGEGFAALIPNPAILPDNDAYLSAILVPIAKSCAKEFKLNLPEDAAALLPAGYVIAPPTIAPVALEAGVAALEKTLSLPADQAAELLTELYGMLLAGDGVIKGQ